MSCGALLSTAVLAAKTPPAKPHIAIITTGGTIAGTQSANGSQAYTAGKFDVQRP